MTSVKTLWKCCSHSVCPSFLYLDASAEKGEKHTKDREHSYYVAYYTSRSIRERPKDKQKDREV